LTAGATAVAFSRRGTSIVNSRLRIPLEVASLERDDVASWPCGFFRQLHDFARELRLARALLKAIRFRAWIFTHE
jgi:hypothetical protein